MHVHLSYYGPAQSVTGRGEETLNTDAASIAALKEALVARYGEAARGWAFALGDQWASPTDPLAEGAEVSVLPPVSGGGPQVWLTRSPIDVTALHRRVSAPGAGAVNLFLGTVRDHFEGQPAVALYYEALEPLAEAELARVETATRALYPVIHMAIVHRLGRLDLEEVSVAIAVSAAHRSAAMAACRFAIDRIKTSVPIYKKELGPSDASWHQGTPTTHHDV